VPEAGGAPGGAAAAAASEAKGDGEEEGEGKGEEEEEEVEGLAAYTREEPPDALLAAAAAGAAGDRGDPGPGPAGAGWAAADPAVARVLRELGRVAAHRHLPSVRDWLRVLVKARAGPACLAADTRSVAENKSHVAPGALVICPARRIAGQHGARLNAHRCALSQKLKCRSVLGCSAWLSEAARRKLTKSNWASKLPGKQPSRSALPPLHINGARQVDVGEPGSAAHARRERLLRACILLRDRLAAAAERVDAAAPALDAACDAACDAAAGPDAGPGPAAPGARARASDARMAAVFGSSSDDDSDAERADAEGPRAGPQGRGRAVASTAASTRAGAPSGAGTDPRGRAARAPAEASRRPGVAGAGRSARAARVGAPPIPIVDPTERPRSAAAATPVGGGPAARVAQPRRVPEPGERAGGAAGSAALPPTVKQKLLQSVRALAAPVRGCHLACWDIDVVGH